MLRNGADRLLQIVAALQLDRGRWVWLLLILLVLCAVLGLGDNVSELLRYDRSAIAAGGWWRLLTAHIVHLDGHHLALNALGLVLMWSLFATDYDAIEWSIIVLAGALAISSGLWWLSPRVAWYVGASGVLHSVVAAGTAKHLAARVWDRWILLVLLSAKLTYEQLGGREPPLVVVDAHLYGAVCGFVVGAALSWRTAIIRHRSSA
ncbi:MAG: rhombosortase [Steroidobacteraceae bacterium]